jgi:hypothetical protein
MRLIPIDHEVHEDHEEEAKPCLADAIHPSGGAARTTPRPPFFVAFVIFVLFVVQLLFPG